MKEIPNAEGKEAVAKLIRAAMNAKKWSAARVAKEAGIAPSTVTRALDPNSSFMPSTRTIRALVDVVHGLRLESEDLLVDRHFATLREIVTKVGPGSIPLVGELRSGAWLPLSQLKADETPRLQLWEPDFEGRSLIAFTVSGESTDRDFKDGTIVIVARSPNESFYAGDIVVIRRRLDALVGSWYETALWDVAEHPEGLETPIYRPRWTSYAEPALADINQPVSELKGPIAEKVPNVLGVVIASYYRPPRNTMRPVVVTPRGTYPKNEQIEWYLNDERTTA